MLPKRMLNVVACSCGLLRLVLVLGMVSLVTYSAQAAPERPEPILDLDEALRLQPDPEAGQSSAEQEVVVPSRTERERLSQLRQLLSPAPVDASSIRIKALEGYLDYDEEDEIIYGPGRTQIRYGRFFLEADTVLIDSRIQEVQAEGNVVFRIDDDEVYADSIRYNMADGDGVGYGVRGEKKPFYFRAIDEDAEGGSKGPQMLRVSKSESIFRNAEFTGCDFKVPHYYVKGTEIILYEQDRIFIRGAKLYIWDVPVLYLPVYSRAIEGSSPWFVKLGYGSRTGARVRLGYGYTHETSEPSFEDDDEYEIRSAGKAEVFIDYLSKVGPGGGFDYRYQFDFKRHYGEMNVYGLYDTDREVTGPIMSNRELIEESNRWAMLWKHYSQITDDLNLVINVDEFSDPDIFYDVLDLFADPGVDPRDRQPERRARTALTYVREAYVIRLMAEFKDRVSLDRYNDPSDPRDDNYEFDLDPGGQLDDDDSDGISKSRWGRVTTKAPQFDFATRLIQLGRHPLYYRGEVHLYNSLDKGLNSLDEEDDAFVQGIEMYHQFLYQYKFSQRYILLAKLGVGAGYADRDRNYDVDFTGSTFPRTEGGMLTFVDDEETFLIGTRRKSLRRDLQTYYFWADSELSFNARFSDALRGTLSWRFRETTENFLGDFYASLGSRTVRGDLYNYKIREHWLEAKLNYLLVRPLVGIFTSAGYNLMSRGDVYSKEPLAYWVSGINWQNQRGTLSASLTGGWRQTQVYDPSDPRENDDNTLFANARMRYQPIHQRWFTSFGARWSESLDERTETSTDEKVTFFTDEDREYDLEFKYGRELGPKYDTQISLRWNEEVSGLREIAWLLQRDMHDAFLVLQTRIKKKAKDRSGRSSEETERDISLSMQMKLPNQYSPFGGEVTTLRQRYHEPVIAD